MAFAGGVRIIARAGDISRHTHSHARTDRHR